MGLALALALGPGAAHAQLGEVAAIGDESINTGLFYRDLRNPQVSDSPGAAVIFHAQTRTAVKPVVRRECIFALDGTGAGTEVACIKDPSPALGRAYLKFGEISANSAGLAAFVADLTGEASGLFRSDDTTVVLVGTAVALPDPLVGTLEEVLSPAVINTGGGVVFHGAIAGVPDARDQAIFGCGGGNGDCTGLPGATGSLTPLVIKSDAVPDRPDRVFCTFDTVNASDYGLVFRALTREVNCGGGGSRVGIFRMPYGGAVETLALEGEASEPAPAPGGTVYGTFPGKPDIADDGKVVFVAGTANLFEARNVYLCVPGTCPAARPAVVVAAGVVDDEGRSLNKLNTATISNAGDIAFDAASKGGGCGVYIRRFSDGDIETVAARGTAVPDAPGSTFRCFGPPAISAGGNLAFRGTFRRSVAPRQGEGIYFLAD
jgi:hypothetical protein